MAGRRVILLMVAFYVALAAVSALWDVLRGGRSGLFAPAGALVVAGDCAIGLAAGLVAVAATRYSARRVHALAELSDYLTRALRSMVGTLTAGEALLLGVASGVGEEMFFRGGIQHSLGLPAATLLFALPHLGPPGRPWVYSTFAAVLGVVLGVVYQATGSIVAPAVMHATLNAVNLRLLSAEAG